jgi:hypothetical protein
LDRAALEAARFLVAVPLALDIYFAGVRSKVILSVTLYLGMSTLHEKLAANSQ